MGRGKGRKHTLAVTCEDHGSGDEEKVSAYKRRGRPQKPLKDDIDEETENAFKDVKTQTDIENGKKRRFAQVKENNGLVKEESDIGTKLSIESPAKSIGFRLVGRRRKNKPRRAAEVGTEAYFLSA